MEIQASSSPDVTVKARLSHYGDQSDRQLVLETSWRCASHLKELNLWPADDAQSTKALQEKAGAFGLKGAVAGKGDWENCCFFER